MLPFILYIFLFGRKYNTYFFTINRKSKKITHWTYGDRRYGGGKYHQHVELPAFNLPKTNNIVQASKIREELQEKITAETGWIFREFV